jgi:hypothetical protein
MGLACAGPCWCIEIMAASLPSTVEPLPNRCSNGVSSPGMHMSGQRRVQSGVLDM